MFSVIRSSVQRQLHRSIATSLSKAKEIDPTQEASLKEQCYLVDVNDKIIGQASKKECHLVQKNGDIPLHRAFSVFLFNKKGDLLLQKRSSSKITYPDFYTNSCCSHPIADFPLEAEEENATGIKRAAVRRLNYELGIPLESLPLDSLNYITRIHYKDEGNGKWGEHEIDYVIFIQADVKIKPNPNEISEISFVPRTELDEYIHTLNGPLTPWFQLILKHRLKLWWDNLENLDEFKNYEKILQLKA
ncbi:isopentenyl-diphosphate Delta-isomerase 1 isoform X2 [Diabrotica virgifera virgifera]|uniref:isopentenyl-diphosphate Delta-isomerase n=1 Tax=Diabrotica virgifera virgifera TaxID=50390 RepID=A0A6P7FCW0_DIAVI|nr:isopentenyl-diphosphate Delta-isomerase 1 isoform X2 [Diabrotica virgifera virgifera]